MHRQAEPDRLHRTVRNTATTAAVILIAVRIANLTSAVTLSTAAAFAVVSTTTFTVVIFAGPVAATAFTVVIGLVATIPVEIGSSLPITTTVKVGTIVATRPFLGIILFVVFVFVNV